MERSTESRDTHSSLASLNSLSAEEAESELLKCCGSTRWARELAAARPFRTLENLINAADRTWWQLKPHDWLEAFRSHPKIGEKKAAAKTSSKSQEWSSDEQSGLRISAQETLEHLAILNRVYEQKFGHIFIVCASGKTSEEMVEILRARLDNERQEELRIAAGEQAKITELRLKKLLEPASA